MAENGATLATRGQRQFSRYLLGGFGVLAVAMSFGENDRRGLFMFDMPEAFAASESFPPMYGHYSDVRRPGLASHRDGRRYIRRGGLPGSGNSAVGAENVNRTGSGAPISSAVASDDQVFAPTLSLTSSGDGFAGNTPLAPGGGLSLTPQTPPSFGSGPVIGITPPVGNVPPSPGPGGPVDPVIPAVPEPSSWLLMILGVGFLGAAIRRHRKLGSIRLSYS